MSSGSQEGQLGRRADGPLDVQRTLELSYGCYVYCTSQEIESAPWVADARTVVIVDTFRNGTTLCIALALGAKDVYLSGKRGGALDELRQAASQRGGDAVFGGELDGRAIPGFHFGNSPLELQETTLVGRSVYIASTNNGGCLLRLMEKCSPREVLWGCMLNAEAVAEHIARTSAARPVVFACAGFGGGLALEDLLCVGRIVVLLQERHRIDLGLLNDGAIAAVATLKHYLTNDGVLRDAALREDALTTWRCGRLLAALGHAKDIELSLSGMWLTDKVLRAAQTTIPRMEGTGKMERIVKLSAARSALGTSQSEGVA